MVNFQYFTTNTTVQSPVLIRKMVPVLPSDMVQEV